MNKHTEERTETHACDCISRQAAIDALHMNLMYRMGTDSNKKRLDDWINGLPSAQPEKRTEERTKTHACDSISRQAAIDEIDSYDVNAPDYMQGWAVKLIEAIKRDIRGLISELPSAQLEQTDCEYCHEDSDGYVRPLEKNLHAWLVRRGKTVKLRVSLKGEYRECDILYCPMCGRRLTDG